MFLNIIFKFKIVHKVGKELKISYVLFDFIWDYGEINEGYNDINTNYICYYGITKLVI